MTQVDIAWVQDTKNPRQQTSGEGVPEGIFYPRSEEISPWDREKSAEWQAQALEAGRASWRAIGPRVVRLARKGVNPSLHALRTKARGYGKKRQHWAAMTECGQTMYQHQGWQVSDGPLGQTTCLSCRRVVRERYEMELTSGCDPRADELLDEYDQQQSQEWWRVQAEWHAPDLVIPNWVGEAVV